MKFERAEEAKNLGPPKQKARGENKRSYNEDNLQRSKTRKVANDTNHTNDFADYDTTIITIHSSTDDEKRDDKPTCTNVRGNDQWPKRAAEQIPSRAQDEEVDKVEPVELPSLADSSGDEEQGGPHEPVSDDEQGNQSESEDGITKEILKTYGNKIRRAQRSLSSQRDKEGHSLVKKRLNEAIVHTLNKFTLRKVKPDDSSEKQPKMTRRVLQK